MAKRKRTYNDLQNITQKTKDRAKITCALLQHCINRFVIYRPLRRMELIFHNVKLELVYSFQDLRIILLRQGCLSNRLILSFRNCFSWDINTLFYINLVQIMKDGSNNQSLVPRWPLFTCHPIAAWTHLNGGKGHRIYFIELILYIWPVLRHEE